MPIQATINEIAEKYAAFCPATIEDFENGFVWHYLSRKCYEMLRLFCAAKIAGPLPTSTSSPEECLPSAAMNRISDEGNYVECTGSSG